MADRKELLGMIRAYEFALIDLGLYLDTHPYDGQAMKLREIYKCKLKSFVDEYEQNYGKLIRDQNDVEESWQEWIKNPWPWDITREGQ